MRIKGFLALFLLVGVFIFVLWTLKSGEEEKIVEDVKAFSRTKLKLTKVNMQTLERLIISYIARNGRAPKSLKDLQAIHIPSSSRFDAWGTEIKYERLSNEEFRLISAGKDRVFDTSDDIVRGD
jgi:hypothetical protein